MDKKKGLSQTPLWVLSEEEMAQAGWLGAEEPEEPEGTDLSHKQRLDVLEDRPCALTNVWDPMRDDMPGKEKACAEKAQSGSQRQGEEKRRGLFRLFAKRRQPRP